MYKKRILFICNESNTVINFRKELILFLQKKNFDVTVIMSDSKRAKDISELKASAVVIPFNNRSKNPISFLLLKRKLYKFICKHKPDVVFTFQAKPNIAGSFAAKKAGITSVYSMIEGLGDPFQPKTFKDKIVKAIVSVLYKKALKASKRVFFLNNDDCGEFIKNGIITEEKCIVIPGIGIDINNYLFEKEQSSNKRVLILSRLLKNKGIIDCCKIAEMVKSKRPDIEFCLFGEEANIKVSDLSQCIDSGCIAYKGFTKDVKNEILNSRLLMSCSSREGFPRIFLEAMALGRVIVASNVVGNRAVIENEFTGYLLPLHDISSFTNKIIEIIDNDDLLSKVAVQARTACENKYDSDIINSIIYNVIH